MAVPMVDGRVSCSHIPEPHISFDRAAGYRARVECRCGKINITLQQTRATLDDAMEDSRVLDAMVRKVAR